MGNFSRDPLQELVDNRGRGYVGLRVEQGVPVLDRDLNLLGELVMSAVRQVFSEHLGDGLPGGATGPSPSRRYRGTTTSASSRPPGVARCWPAVSRRRSSRR